MTIVQSLKDLETRIAEWVAANPDALAETARRAKEASESARRAAHVDPEIMRKVVTI